MFFFSFSNFLNLFSNGSNFRFLSLNLLKLCAFEKAIFLIKKSKLFKAQANIKFKRRILGDIFFRLFRSI